MVSGCILLEIGNCFAEDVFTDSINHSNWTFFENNNGAFKVEKNSLELKVFVQTLDLFRVDCI